MVAGMRRTARLLAVAGSLASCDLLTGPDDLERLDQAWARWEGLGYGSYRYEVVQSCFCALPAVGHRVVVVVRDGSVVSASLAATGELLPPSTWHLIPTIDALFLTVSDAIHDGADDLDVRYDVDLGYPRLIDIDWLEHAIDDEATISADGLIPLR
jgi:hypothetical protein